MKQIKDHIKISAIITTCNRPVEILERAVKSVAGQSRLPDELIIVDDSAESITHSEEMTAMLSKYAGITDLHYLRNDGCKGACFSRNRGVEAAQGEYIAFLDDDDEWTKDKLLLQERKALENRRAVLITGYIRILTEGTTAVRIYNRGWEFEGNVLSRILGNNFVGGCSAPLLKKSAVISCGCFDEGFTSSQDYDLWIRLAHVGEFGFVRTVIVDYHMHPGNITDDFERRICGWKQIYRKHHKDFVRYPEARGEFFDLMAVNSWECRRRVFAIRMLGRRIRTCGIRADVFRTVIIMSRITAKHILRRFI